MWLSIDNLSSQKHKFPIFYRLAKSNLFLFFCTYIYVYFSTGKTFWIWIIYWRFFKNAFGFCGYLCMPRLGHFFALKPVKLEVFLYVYLVEETVVRKWRKCRFSVFLKQFFKKSNFCTCTLKYCLFNEVTSNFPYNVLTRRIFQGVRLREDQEILSRVALKACPKPPRLFAINETSWTKHLKIFLSEGEWGGFQNFKIAFPEAA